MLELLITIARMLYRLDARAEPGSILGEGSPDLGSVGGKEAFPAVRSVHRDARRTHDSTQEKGGLSCGLISEAMSLV